MAELSAPSLPAACGNCVTTTQLSGAQARQSPWNLLRAGDGRMRLDFGNMSAITDLAAQRTTILDHVARTARIMPFSPEALKHMVPGLAVPGAPGGMPPHGAVNIEQLGKQFIEGHECQGLRYVLPSSGAGVSPSIMEVWNSTKLHLPVLTTTTGPFGQQTLRCTHVPGEPDPSKFQIPPGYQRIQAPPPPSMPATPRIPR